MPGVCRRKGQKAGHVCVEGGVGDVRHRFEMSEINDSSKNNCVLGIIAELQVLDDSKLCQER